MKKIVIILSVLIGLGTVSDGYTAVRMPGVFGDNMVLQRDTLVSLWGWAEGKRVSVRVSWSKERYMAVPDGEGKWKVRIATPPAGGPYSISVSDGSVLTMNNVMIGEVWVCAGQSNMSMKLMGMMSQPVRGAAEAIMTSGRYRDRIRMLTVPNRASDRPEEDFTGASWLESSPANTSGFGAVAFFFARYLTEALEIPVGIINCSWGGSDIEAWMDEASNRKARPDIQIPPKGKTPVPKQPVKLYNGLIAPVAGYAARGFLWYQGEGNARPDGRYEWYAAQLEALVSFWRTLWGNESMPFYLVQIAPFGSGNPKGTWIPFLVEQQLKAARSIPGCGIVPTTDIGEMDCIHPAEKKTVGFRLAKMAMVSLYGMKGVPATGPVYKSVRFHGKQAVVEFDNARRGLMPARQPVTGFEIAGRDRVFYPAEARVDKARSKVVVSSEKVPEPVAVRYAFRNYVEANLVDNFGVAAFPFRTDDWDDVK